MIIRARLFIIYEQLKNTHIPGRQTRQPETFEKTAAPGAAALPNFSQRGVHAAPSRASEVSRDESSRDSTTFRGCIFELSGPSWRAKPERMYLKSVSSRPVSDWTTRGEVCCRNVAPSPPRQRLTRRRA